MNNRKISIGKKTVYQSEPFLPDSRFMTGFVGRTIELKYITAAWMAGKNTLPLSPLLIGEPGVGKNRLVYELAQKTNRDLYIFQGHEDVTAEDLACSVRFSDQKKGMMDYMISPLVTAMYNGGICFIDEIGKIRPRALALLVSVLDERQYIDSILLGERIQAHPGFRFIAATNTTDINLLPEFILSRMRPTIWIDQPLREEISQVIRSQYHEMKEEIDNLLNQFWELWHNYEKPGKNLSVRDVIHLFSLASNLSAFDSSGGMNNFSVASRDNPFSLSGDENTRGIQPVHLRVAFDQLFKTETL